MSKTNGDESRSVETQKEFVVVCQECGPVDGFSLPVSELSDGIPQVKGNPKLAHSERCGNPVVSVDLESLPVGIKKMVLDEEKTLMWKPFHDAIRREMGSRDKLRQIQENTAGCES